MLKTISKKRINALRIMYTPNRSQKKTKGGEKDDKLTHSDKPYPSNVLCNLPNKLLIFAASFGGKYAAPQATFSMDDRSTLVTLSE